MITMISAHTVPLIILPLDTDEFNMSINISKNPSAAEVQISQFPE